MARLSVVIVIPSSLPVLRDRAMTRQSVAVHNQRKPASPSFCFHPGSDWASTAVHWQPLPVPLIPCCNDRQVLYGVITSPFYHFRRSAVPEGRFVLPDMPRPG